MADNPLSSLGEGLTKPATVLIEKVSDAVGGLYKPIQIRRVAQAQADAALIHAESEIEITALHQRGLLRWIEEIAEEQFNMEEVTRKALSLVTEDASPADMDTDWIKNFFAKCRGISDDDMQDLWARILAGEANRPGSFSRKTVNLMEDIAKDEADLFVRLCSFNWHFGPVIFNLDEDIYTRQGIDFMSLNQLANLGLVHFTGIPLQRTDLPAKFVMSYYNRQLELTFSGQGSRTLSTGLVVYTQAGEQVSRICNAKPLNGFYEYASAKWEAENNVVSVHRFPEPLLP